MRDRVTGKRIEDHITLDADQLKELDELTEEFLGDFIGDTVAVTQHKLITCSLCGEAGGALVKVGDDLYRHVGGSKGCKDDSVLPPFNRDTRRKLGMR